MCKRSRFLPLLSSVYHRKNALSTHFSAFEVQNPPLNIIQSGIVLFICLTGFHPFFHNDSGGNLFIPIIAIRPVLRCRRLRQYLFVSSVFAIVPASILFMSAEKHLNSRLTAGGVYGQYSRKSGFLSAFTDGMPFFYAFSPISSGCLHLLLQNAIIRLIIFT